MPSIKATWPPMRGRNQHVQNLRTKPPYPLASHESNQKIRLLEIRCRSRPCNRTPLRYCCKYRTRTGNHGGDCIAKLPHSPPIWQIQSISRHRGCRLHPPTRSRTPKQQLHRKPKPENRVIDCRPFTHCFEPNSLRSTSLYQLPGRLSTRP